jgi:hypothetical protein
VPREPDWSHKASHWCFMKVSYCHIGHGRAAVLAGSGGWEGSDQVCANVPSLLARRCKALVLERPDLDTFDKLLISASWEFPGYFIKGIKGLAEVRMLDT